MLTFISIADSSFDQYNVNESSGPIPKPLANLSKINVFVGANNSGKSRFLRLLANTKDLKFIVSINKDFRMAIEENISTLIKIFTSKKIDVNGALERLNGVSPLGFTIEHTGPFKTVLELLQELEMRDYNTYSAKGSWPDKSVFDQIKKIASETAEKLKNFINCNPQYNHNDFKRIYFPTLRGLRPLGDTKADYYQNRTERDYFPQNRISEIFTGLGLYNEIQSLLLGDLKSRNIIADFEEFLSREFFEGETITLIPKLKSDVLDVKIGNEKEFPIFNLGDGIQSIIILTFPLFKYRDESVLAFFEEPELYMHPGLQRTFLNVLAKDFSNHQFFLTTHSNHFLDLTLDSRNVSVFTFKKEFDTEENIEKTAKFKVENVSNADFRSLELLGVRNSSVFLSNCTIWVEGITDRRYLQHYIHLYQTEHKSEDDFREFKEDLHFSFVEYGGGNITHWSFLDNNDDNIDVEHLCGKLFLICDKDKSQAKDERQRKLKEVLRDRFYCLECREIENLLTLEILKKVVRRYERENVEFNEITEKDYKEKMLGEFIESKLLKKKTTRKGGYKAESGTIKDKVGFCDQVIDIAKYEQLSNEAKKLTEQLYSFIRDNNSSKIEKDAKKNTSTTDN